MNAAADFTSQQKRDWMRKKAGEQGHEDYGQEMGGGGEFGGLVSINRDDGELQGESG